jgi:phosphoribosylanthranilate isomerase
MEDVRMCARHGADILGFVVEYPRPVPWNVSAVQAKALMAGAGGAATCIVTAGGAEHVLRLAGELCPDYIQLHGDETPAGAAEIVRGLNGRGVRVIKAVYPHMPNLLQSAHDYEAAGVWALLLDPRNPQDAQRGGGADFCIWQELSAAVRCPVILAGGLAPGNAAGAVAKTNAAILDLMTGIESAPGIKDERKVAALFRALAG